MTDLADRLTAAERDRSFANVRPRDASTLIIVDRSGELSRLTSPTTGRIYSAEALWSLNLPTYEPSSDACPGCAANLPIEAPGSSGLSAA